MTPESPSPLITVRENKIMRVPLIEAVKATKEVEKLIQAKDFATAMTLRDAEFKEYLHAYRNMAAPERPKLVLPGGQVRFLMRWLLCNFCQPLTVYRECALESSTSERRLVV